MTVCMNVDGFKIDKINTEKLLGVKFDKKLISVKEQIEKYLFWPELHDT